MGEALDYRSLDGAELRRRYRDGDVAAREELDRRKLEELKAERALAREGLIVDPSTGEVLGVQETRPTVRPTPPQARARTTTPATASPKPAKRRGFDWQAAAANDRGDD